MNMHDALKELLPAKVRLTIYVVAGTALAVLTAFLAADGHWGEAAVSLLGTLQSWLAGANVYPDTGDRYPARHAKD